MAQSDCDIVESIYGFNWAAVGSREVGFEQIEAVVSPKFKSQFSREVGGREVDGVTGLREFGEALEQDFERFSYNAIEFTDAGEGVVVVTGVVNGIARASKMPLSGPFGHVWHLEDGQVVKVEAYLDSDAALKAAGADIKS